MKNLLVTWDLPTARIGGGALAVDDILHVEVSLSADGGENFSVLGSVPSADTQEFGASDLDIASYIVRFVVVLVDGQRSANVDLPFDVVDDSPPNGVVNVAIDLT